MQRPRVGERVRVADAPEHAQHMLGRMGTVREMQGFDLPADTVLVWFEEGMFGSFHSNQLESVEGAS